MCLQKAMQYSFHFKAPNSLRVPEVDTLVAALALAVALPKEGGSVLWDTTNCKSDAVLCGPMRRIVLVHQGLCCHLADGMFIT